MNQCDRCPLVDKKNLAKSNNVAVQRCQCGEYFLTNSEGTHQATGDEKALAEMVESLIKLKLPGAIPSGRN